MKVEFTPAMLKEAVLEVVDEVGEDFVYPNEEKQDGFCRYTHDGRGSCIFGRAFIKLGIDVDIMASDFEGFGVFDLIEENLMNYQEPSIRPEGFDRINIHLFANVQREQDKGVPWGKAVENLRKANLA